MGVGVLLDPSFENWSDGHLATAAGKVGPGLRSLVVLGGAASSLGQLAVITATSSRALWSMADGGFAPHFLAYTSPRTGAPIGALVAQVRELEDAALPSRGPSLPVSDPFPPRRAWSLPRCWASTFVVS